MPFEEIMHKLLHTLLHSVLDTAKLLPFLFLTYLLMELLEHKAGERFERVLRKSGRFGPLLGGALGAVPQCGFSAVAAGFYAGRVITPGTLIAVFLATSDEMIPVAVGKVVEGEADPLFIVKLLGIKIACGILVGLGVDLVLSLCKRNTEALTLRNCARRSIAIAKRAFSFRRSSTR